MNNGHLLEIQGLKTYFHMETVSPKLSTMSRFISIRERPWALWVKAAVVKV